MSRLSLYLTASWCAFSAAFAMEEPFDDQGNLIEHPDASSLPRTRTQLVADQDRACNISLLTDELRELEASADFVHYKTLETNLRNQDILMQNDRQRFENSKSELNDQGNPNLEKNYFVSKKISEDTQRAINRYRPMIRAYEIKKAQLYNLQNEDNDILQTNVVQQPVNLFPLTDAALSQHQHMLHSNQSSTVTYQHLPTDVLREILMQSSLPELLHLRQVDKRHRYLVDDIQAQWVHNQIQPLLSSDIKEAEEAVNYFHLVIRPTYQTYHDLMRHLNAEAMYDAPQHDIYDSTQLIAKAQTLFNHSYFALQDQISQMTPQDTQVDYQQKNLRIIPREIGQLDHCVGLCFNYNQLFSIPFELKNILTLRTLKLSNNQFLRFSGQNLPVNLDDLNLSDNKISSIFDILTPNIRYIRLSRNKLESIPPQIFTLSNLDLLDVPSNSIKSIPVQIEDFRGDCTFNFIDNKIELLPEVLLETYKRIKLRVEGNPIDKNDPVTKTIIDKFKYDKY